MCAGAQSIARGRTGASMQRPPHSQQIDAPRYNRCCHPSFSDAGVSCARLNTACRSCCSQRACCSCGWLFVCIRVVRWGRFGGVWTTHTKPKHKAVRRTYLAVPHEPPSAHGALHLERHGVAQRAAVDDGGPAEVDHLFISFLMILWLLIL